MTEKPLDAVFQSIIDSIAVWEKKNTPQVIGAQVKKTLDNGRETIILKLLGFDNRWSGKWELDHCNGRAGNSPAGDYLKGVASEEIKKWFDSVELPPVGDILTKSMVKDYKSRVKRLVGEGLKHAADREAERIVDSIIKDLTETTKVDDYLTMKSLIEENNK